MADYTVKEMSEADWEEVLSVYLDGIRTGNATFETSAPRWEDWDAAHLRQNRLIARSESGVLGWAALGPVSRRSVYAGVAEVSIYVKEQSRGCGVGRALLSALVEGSEQSGLWMLQAGIFPENIASINLHLKCGFRLVGRRERIARMHGVWRDVVLLERRSQVVGID
ncbi:MAG TPA: GNAT family N-acetyltransferase [Pyrinomonadaceae bacterium]|jgi:phosphinothricin acetyltransferase